MSVRVERMRERRRKFRKIFLVLFLSAAIFGFLRFGCSLEKLEVEGCSYYEEESLRSWLCTGTWENQTWYLYLKLRFGEKPSIPFIEEIEVDFVNLHTLRLGVYEKEVIGCIAYMGEYVCFDKDGIMVGSLVDKPEGVPSVTGISYKKIVYNEKVETSEYSLFPIILNVTQLIEKYGLSVSQIAFSYNQEITLSSGDIQILLGKREQYDEPLSALPGILKEADGLKGVLNMKEYSQKNQKVVFVKEE